MIESFKTSTLIDRGALAIGDGYRAKNSELSSTGIPFARAANINSGFQFSDADRFPIEDLGKCGSKISQPGDVVFTSKGSVGRFAFVSSNTEQFVYSPQLCFWRSLDSEVIDPVWLYYWMYGPEFQNQIGYLKTQTDMAEYVSLRDQRAMSITLPPVMQQRAMAAPLLLLDRKVELNRQTARTLEELAQRLFKSWFVDFDPVRARMAGRQPAHTPPEIAVRFPDRLVDSSLGLIPEGWRCGKLGDVVTLLDSKRVPLSKTQRAELPGPYPYYGAASCMDYVGDYLFDDVLVLMAEDGSVTDSRGRPTLQYVWGKCWVNNHAHVLKGCDPFSDEMVYLSLADKEITPFVTGAVQPKLNQRNLRSIPLVIPSSLICANFSEIVSPLFERIRQLHDESDALSELRDRLLPKLISGKIRMLHPEGAQAPSLMPESMNVE